MDDLISRQAAIDAIRGEIEINGYSHVVDVLEQLPSAQPKRCEDCENFSKTRLLIPQPERTCVNCGRTANNGGWYADGGTRCPIEEHYALPKDGYCHLWEKRNVTDDDYPERRTDG